MNVHLGNGYSIALLFITPGFFVINKHLSIQKKSTDPINNLFPFYFKLFLFQRPTNSESCHFG